MKSKILALGSWHADVQLDFPYATTSNILGIKFNRDLQATRDLTIVPIVNTIKRLSAEPKIRQLCVVQRVAYANMVILSKLWYAAQVLQITAQQIRQIQLAVLYFVWSGHIFRVPYHVIVRPKVEGGLGLCHISLKCKALYEATRTSSTNNTKQIYLTLMSNLEQPLTRIMEKNPHVLWNNVWRNVSQSFLPVQVRSFWYFAVQNKNDCKQYMSTV